MRLAIIIGIWIAVLWDCTGAYSQSTGNLKVVDHYEDDFSTDKAQSDAAIASTFWIDSAFPLDIPHLVYSKVSNGSRGLVFRARHSQPAQIGYGIPVVPDRPVRVLPLLVEVELDVSVMPNDDPLGPTLGYISYKISADGVNWSGPVTLGTGHHALHLGYLDTCRYLVLAGAGVEIDNVRIDLYLPPGDIYVPKHFVRIQDAIDMAKDGDRIIVSDQRYTGIGNRGVSFRGKSLVLASENGPANCIIDCQGMDRAFVFDSGESRTAVLDGFTIINGRAAEGAGIYCEGSSPTISNCLIADCEAAATDKVAAGGGILCRAGSPLIRYCDVIGNKTLGKGYGGHGGGICLAQECGAVIEFCTFASNLAGDSDSANDLGGAIYMESSSTVDTQQPLIRNCLIAANASGDYGGGIACVGWMPQVLNCTIAHNTAGHGRGGLSLDGGLTSKRPAVLKNCIVWGNGPDQIRTIGGGLVEVTYSDVQGGMAGSGNVDANPIFADADSLDYHLASVAGRWDPLGQTWKYDHVTSPCIDAGSPADLVGGERMPHGNRINLGVFGGTAQASHARGALTFHVATSGNDINDGLTVATAFAAIQTAIVQARDGDRVLVWPGTYVEDVDFLGKAIQVQSAAEAATVVAKRAYAFTFHYAEGPGSVLRNMMIRDCSEGAILCHAASPTLVNLTLVDNTFGISALEGGQPAVSNCIFWGNAGDLHGFQAKYSCIQHADQADGEGNIQRDPLFVDPNTGNYHLQSRFGRYWPEHDVWVVDRATSPCIDTGDPSFGASQEPRENGGRVNVGAYGGTGYASMSPPQQAGDLNSDGLVDFKDLALFADRWLQSSP